MVALRPFHKAPLPIADEPPSDLSVVLQSRTLGLPDAYFALCGAKYPHQCCGGELQRVFIARAIAPKPRLVVLDEAVSGLDMIVQARVLEVLNVLRIQLHMAFLLISHDIHVLHRMCNELAVLHRGRVVDRCPEMGALDQLTHPASRTLLTAILPALPR
jgi:nickel transport system ATP-binding protein